MQLLTAPTPYVIGLPTNFLERKRHARLQEDVWLIDLDKNAITSPEQGGFPDIPTFPEPEGKVLRNHMLRSAP